MKLNLKKPTSNEYAVFRQILARKKYEVKVSGRKIIWPPLLLEWVNCETPDFDLVTEDNCVVYSPPSFATANGFLTRGQITFSRSRQVVETSDGVDLLIDTSVEFQLSRNPKDVERMLEAAMFAPFAGNFARKVETTIAGVVGEMTLREAVISQSQIRLTCLERLRTVLRQSGEDWTENNGIHILQLVMAVRRAEEVDGYDAPLDAALDLANELRRMQRYFDEVGDDEKLERLERIGHALLEKEKVRLIANAPGKLVVLPWSKGGMGGDDLTAVMTDRIDALAGEPECNKTHGGRYLPGQHHRHGGGGGADEPPLIEGASLDDNDKPDAA